MTVAFTPTFDRAVSACARAQVLVTRAAEAAARSREARRSSHRVRQHVAETRDAWKSAEQSSALMRHQLADVVHAMRAAGMSQDDAAAAVRAHIRFVLYDRGMREREAELVVERATAWVEDLFRAA